MLILNVSTWLKSQSDEHNTFFYLCIVFLCSFLSFYKDILKHPTIQKYISVIDHILQNTNEHWRGRIILESEIWLFFWFESKIPKTHLYRVSPYCTKIWVSYKRLQLEIEPTFLPWQHSILDSNHSMLHCYLLFSCHPHSCIFMWSPEISSSTYFRWLSMS